MNNLFLIFSRHNATPVEHYYLLILLFFLASPEIVRLGYVLIWSCEKFSQVYIIWYVGYVFIELWPVQWDFKNTLLLWVSSGLNSSLKRQGYLKSVMYRKICYIEFYCNQWGSSMFNHWFNLIYWQLHQLYWIEFYKS